jgi:flagellar protein FliS
LSLNRSAPPAGRFRGSPNEGDSKPVTRKDVNPYFRTRVMTASPEELHLMLYDGAIKFCGQGREAIVAGRIEDSYSLLVKAQSIVLELLAGLKRDAAPELCGKQAALYNFIYRRLVEANLKKDADALDDAVRILTYCRETWVLVMQKLAEGRGGRLKPADTASPNAPETNEPIPVSIDIQG